MTYIYNGTEKRKNKRRQFIWHTNGKSASKMLQQLLPYFITKKDQTELAIEFQKYFGKYYGIFGTPKDVVESRERCYNECRCLKKLDLNEDHIS